MLETVILGAGPAGTGPLVWAAGAGVLGAWLERRIAIIDQRRAMGGTIGNYALNADTLGGTFLECLDGAAFGMLRDDPSARALEGYRDGLPPLPLVGRFFERLGAVLAAEIARHPRSRFLPQTHVLALRIARDGSVVVDLADPYGRRYALCAASAVLALGGRPSVGWQDIELQPGIALKRWQDKILLSDRLLARGGATVAEARLAALRGSPQVIILGGSHSAFSVAWTLLERIPAVRFACGGIQILYRTLPPVFYPSRAAATADGYRFTESDVCPATGRVHRLGGLRGDGREIFRRVQGLGGSPSEERVRLRAIVAMRPDELREVLDRADLIVPAFGYRLATVPVYAQNGQRIELARSGPSVDANARLRTEEGGTLPNVFGIGLGSGFRPWGALAGEPAFRGQQNSAWLYQHGLGALIYDGVRRWAEQRHERAAEMIPLLRACERTWSYLPARHAPLPGLP
jgi:hypothetical protein